MSDGFDDEYLCKIRKGLIPVDVDLIKELRLKGFSVEAESLLESFHNNKRMNTLHEEAKKIDSV